MDCTSTSTGGGDLFVSSGCIVRSLDGYAHYHCVAMRLCYLAIAAHAGAGRVSSFTLELFCHSALFGPSVATIRGSSGIVCTPFVLVRSFIRPFLSLPLALLLDSYGSIARLWSHSRGAVVVIVSWLGFCSSFQSVQRMVDLPWDISN